MDCNTCTHYDGERDKCAPENGCIYHPEHGHTACAYEALEPKEDLFGEFDTRCCGCASFTKGGECLKGTEFGKPGCPHWCDPREDLFDDLEGDPDKTFKILSLEDYRRFRKQGALPLVIRADRFAIQLEPNCYPPEVYDELTHVMARLMRYELRLFEE